MSLFQAKGSLSNDSYQRISSDIKNNAYKIIADLPENRMILYNIDTLVAAALYTTLYSKRVTNENIDEFLRTTKKLPHINHLDFIRYIRDLSLHF